MWEMKSFLKPSNNILLKTMIYFWKSECVREFQPAVDTKAFQHETMVGVPVTSEFKVGKAAVTEGLSRNK
jgi:hypothetical protein